ncbi:MAG: two component transcriptional regulator, winged helix family [Mucilaginibacter sp.]|nr:two component transcriptional regulator, winged helix family [Mucilaginibacter sp.]
MQKITPCLWFDGKDGKVEEALNFYTSVFKNSKISDITYYGEVHPQMAGQILVARFVLDGQELMILNGGPGFKFTEAISLSVNCETQEEIDFYWDALLADGGQESQCGWLKDKFGLSWQVAPSEIEKMLRDKDPKKASNVMMAMMQMVKIDIKTLEEAYNK